MQSSPYRPKADHPWRGYQNKTAPSKEPSTPKRPLREFLQDVVENWDTYKVPPSNFTEREYVSLARMNSEKQAEWLISFLKKHWMGSYKGAIILE